MPFERRRILGVPVDLVTEPEVLEYIQARVASHAPAQICTVNAEFIMLARRDPTFAGVLEGSDLNTADGAGVVWALRRQGIAMGRRVGGSDLIWSVSEQAARLGHRMFFLGAGEGIAEMVANRLAATYPGLRVAGSFAGSPSPADESSIVDLIRRSGADILCVAFGAPAQEMWIARNLEATGAYLGLGVGGSFDYVAGVTRRAPLWMREHALDWLWRLVTQPRRWRRMLVLPVFAWQVLREPVRPKHAERIDG